MDIEHIAIDMVMRVNRCVKFSRVLYTEETKPPRKLVLAEGMAHDRKEITMQDHLIPFSTEFFGDEVNLVCPECGFEYTHLLRTTIHARHGEDGDSDAINVTTDGRIHRSVDIPNPSRRRDSVVLHFACEEGHLFDLKLIQHKGNTFFEVEVTGYSDHWEEVGQ